MLWKRRSKNRVWKFCVCPLLPRRASIPLNVASGRSWKRRGRKWKSSRHVRFQSALKTKAMCGCREQTRILILESDAEQRPEPTVIFYGGTFDPPHVGHQRVMAKARAAFPKAR